MTGAGFGGSSIALVKTDEFESFREKVSKDYEIHFHIRPMIFIAKICDGLRYEDIY